MECDLDGTTAATCSGYSSWRADSPNTYFTGSTEQSWTSTLSDKAVEWGTLTLTDEPSRSSNPLSITITTGDVEPTNLDEEDMLYEPEPSDSAAGLVSLGSLLWVFAAFLAGVVMLEGVL